MVGRNFLDPVSCSLERPSDDVTGDFRDVT